MVVRTPRLIHAGCRPNGTPGGEGTRRYLPYLTSVPFQPF